MDSIPRAKSTREIRHVAAGLAQLLTTARVHVASGYYRSCRDCHELWEPVFADERLCPACAELRKVVARGIAPLPN